MSRDLSTALAIILAGLALSANAGKIVNEDSGSPAIGVAGWNTDNITTTCYMSDGSALSCADWLTQADVGAYFLSDIYNDTTKVGQIAGKNYPVGEPEGIRVVEGDTSVQAPNPQNCIMTTSYLEGAFLDSASPEKTICGSPFQSHKRFKVRMLPESVANVTDPAANPEGKGIDIVFNVEDSGEATSYQVFQKINNWTDVRLAGYKLQLGFGTGSSFTPASSVPEINDSANELSVTVDNNIWASNEVATFAHGLFGPADQHFPPPGGYFDNTTRAGYVVQEYADDTDEVELNSGAKLGSTYDSTTGGTATSVQFGDWLPYSWIPQGIFWDDDNNPETDAQLMAWWGDDGTGTYGWLQGQADSFAAVPETTLANWFSQPAIYFTGGIEDLVNVGLNYVINIDDTDIATDWPTWNGTTSTATFTVRVIPIVSTDQTVPGYMDPANAPDLPDTGDTNGGSGGCTIGTGTAWNITMPAILLALLGYGLIRRRRKQ